MKLAEITSSFDDTIGGKEAVVVCKSHIIRGGWWVCIINDENRKPTRLIIEPDIREVISG